VETAPPIEQVTTMTAHTLSAYGSMLTGQVSRRRLLVAVLVAPLAMVASLPPLVTSLGLALSGLAVCGLVYDVGTGPTTRPPSAGRIALVANGGESRRRSTSTRETGRAGGGRSRSPRR
jgi:hypothetical protein